MGIGRNFANFVRGDRGMCLIGRACLYYTYNERIMVTTKIGKHTVEMHDTIEELPVVRFHKYQKLLLIDAGVGADITAFDQRLEKARLFLYTLTAISHGRDLPCLNENSRDKRKHGGNLIRNRIKSRYRCVHHFH